MFLCVRITCHNDDIITNFIIAFFICGKAHQVQQRVCHSFDETVKAFLNFINTRMDNGFKPFNILAW